MISDSGPSEADQELNSIGFEVHDHGICKRQAVEEAEALCHKRGARLTPLRRRVLELIWDNHAPLGAYDILERLSREQKSAKPPTVYRALAFLVDHGLVHRIDSLNAFVGCALYSDSHKASFLICSKCGNVAEFADKELHRIISKIAASSRFAVERQTVEIAGTCQRCLESQSCD